MKKVLTLMILLSGFSFASPSLSPQELERAIEEGRAIKIGPQKDHLEHDAEGRTVKVSSQDYRITSPDGSSITNGSLTCSGICRGALWTGMVCGNTENCEPRRAYCTKGKCPGPANGPGACIPECNRAFTTK